MKVARYPKLKGILPKAMGSKTQAEVAAWCGVSQAAVSDWMNGYKSPRPVYAAILASKLHLDPRELAAAAGRDEETVVRLYNEFHLGVKAYHDLVEAYVGAPDRINKIWFQGNPELAFDEATVKDIQLKRALERYRSPERRKPLLRIRSRLQMELASAFWVGNPPEKAVRFLRSSAKEQVRIAAELGDEEPLGRAYYCFGNAFYGLKEYGRSRDFFRRAFPLIGSDEYRKIVTPRMIAIESAHLGDKVGFDEAESQVKYLLDRGVPSSLATIMSLEGLGRAQAILGNPQARHTLEEGWTALDKARSDGIRMKSPQLQLMRGEVEAALHLNTMDDAMVESLAERGLAIARDHGYAKYARHFEELLREVVA